MRTTALSMAAVALAVFVLALNPASTAYSQEPPIYGSQLMTEQERLEYRERMRAATTAEERERIRLEHHAQMQERAREMGIELPDEPPMTGMGRGMGQGQGMGTGQRRMMSPGAGPGRRGN
jgi:hypothetical protein